MSAHELRFYLRLDPVEIPYVARDPWVVSGAAYRGSYVDPPGTPRRRVRLHHPTDERTVVLHADQLEPDVSPWPAPAPHGSDRSSGTGRDRHGPPQPVDPTGSDDGGR